MTYEDEIKDIAKEYGVRIVTPQGKLDAYFEGLKIIQKEQGNHLAEARQWEAIGDQYKRMHQYGHAKAAYQSAMNALEKVDISEFVSTEHKLHWENGLMTKLKNVE